MAVLEDVVKAIAFRLGNRQGMDEQITAELIRLKSRLESNTFLPWFLISENKFNNCVIDENRLRIPTDFIAEYEEGALWVFDNSNKRTLLVKDDQDVLAEEYSGQCGLPVKYALTHQYFRLYPTPDQEYKTEVLIYGKQPAFTPGEENNWFNNAFDYVVAECCLSIARAQNDRVKIKSFTTLVAEEKTSLVNLHDRRVTANRDYSKED